MAQQINKELFKNGFYKEGFESELLTTSEVEYWKGIVKKNLKIGVELEFEFDSGTKRGQAQLMLQSKYTQSRDVHNFDGSGLFSITGDGSLTNGIEIPMVGRRVDYWNVVNQFKPLLTDLLEAEAKTTERCGLHNHMLLSYGRYGREAEKDMPSIIFRNFMQLLRRHMVELMWITSTASDKTKMTRWERFRTYKSLMRFTPSNGNRSLAEYVRSVNSGHYEAIRLNSLQLTQDGKHVRNFHVELRFPDGSLSATQIASQQVLFASILLKAIEFSKYGIVNTGTKEMWAEQKELLEKFVNTFGASRYSSPPSVELMDKIQIRAQAMVLYFGNNIRTYGDEPYAILQEMATMPVSLKMRELKTWDKVEKAIETKDTRDKQSHEEIAWIIDTMEIIGTNSKKEWEEALAERLGISYKMANHRVWKLGKVRRVAFDKQLGAVVFE